MNLGARVHGTKIIVRFLSIRSRIWFVATSACVRVLSMIVSRRGRALGMQRARRIEQFKRVGESITARVQMKPLSSEHRLVLQKTIADFQLQLGTFRAEISNPPTTSTFVAVGRAAEALLRNARRRKQKNQSLRRLIGQIESDTYGCDLALWFVLPAQYSEDMTGDLQEELALREVADGRQRALQWYRRQVRITIYKVITQKLIVARMVVKVLRLIWDLLRWHHH